MAEQKPQASGYFLQETFASGGWGAKNNTLAEDFLKTFQNANFPHKITNRFDVVLRLDNGNAPYCETYLLLEKESGAHYVLKLYRQKEEMRLIKTLYANEAKILVDLSHDGIPEYSGEPGIEEDGCLYTIRKYVEGMTLDKYRSGHPIDEAMVVDIMIQLCGILDYLHNLKEPVIHRDIKPSNIVINPQTQKVTLIDFGISRKYRACEADADTISLGTRNYSPPEQYGFAQTDCRSDIYSLGILMRYLLTGSSIRGGSLTVPDKENVIKNNSLERIVSKCSEIDRENRYKSAAALKKALLEHKTQKKKKAAVLFTVFNTHAKSKKTDEARLKAFMTQNRNNRRIFREIGWNPADSDTWENRKNHDTYAGITWSGKKEGKIKEIFFNKMGLTGSLDVSGFTDLIRLHVSDNHLTGINVSDCEILLSLICCDNQLTSLDLSDNRRLYELYCYRNQLANIILSGCTRLTHINCFSNRLTRLDLPDCSDLVELDLNQNRLTSIDLSGFKKIEFLRFGDSLLTEIDISMLPALTELDCWGNPMGTLDVSNNTALKRIECSVCALTSLDLSKNTALEYIRCNGNQLRDIPAIEDFTKLFFVCISHNKINLENEANKAKIAKIQRTINGNKLDLPPDWKEQAISSPEKWKSLFNKYYVSDYRESWFDWGMMTGGFTYSPQD